MRLSILTTACFLCGCSTLNSSLWGKKVRVTQSDIGLKDPFYVVSKNISPKSTEAGFEFPIKIIFNSNLYETVTIDTGFHAMVDLTGGSQTGCEIGIRDEETGEPSKPARLEFTTVMQGPEDASPTGEQPPSDRPRKEMLLVNCRQFTAPTGHDFRFDIKILQMARNGANTPTKGKVSIPLTVSYNGWLVSFLGGLTLTSGFVYLGYLKARP